jgi:hypothetical protein
MRRRGKPRQQEITIQIFTLPPPAAIEAVKKKNYQNGMHMKDYDGKKIQRLRGKVLLLSGFNYSFL